MSKKKKVRVKFLKDNDINKAGEITLMNEDAVEMYQKGDPELIEIIKEKEKERKTAKERLANEEAVDATFDRNGTYLAKHGIEPERKESKEEANERKLLIRNFLTNKDLFNEITEIELDKQIVGEIPTRKVIFLCACGMLVENAQIASYNLLVNSSAGAGKDYITSKVLSILPSSNYVKKTRISPTVFTYWHNSKFEPDWTWDGKVFYTEDISESVLNSEVFKVMCSSGSSATIVKNQMAIDIHIKGKPVMITTTATAVPNPELTRRFEFCNLDESIDQTGEIMKRHSLFAEEGINPELDSDIQKSLSYLKRVKVKIPYAKLLDKYFPKNNIMMRTKYPRFLDYIKASAAFHQYQRDLDGDNYLLADGQDYDIAREVILKLTSNKYMIPLTVNQQKIMKFFEENPHINSYAQDILSKIGNIMALKNFQNNLGLLVHYGLLSSKIEKDNLNRDIEYYELPEHLRSGDLLNLPKFDELIKQNLEEN